MRNAGSRFLYSMNGQNLLKFGALKNPNTTRKLSFLYNVNQSDADDSLQVLVEDSLGIVHFSVHWEHNKLIDL